MEISKEFLDLHLLFSTEVYFLKAHFSVDLVNDCKIKDTESKITVLPEYRVLLEK